MERRDETRRDEEWRGEAKVGFRWKGGSINLHINEKGAVICVLRGKLITHGTEGKQEDMTDVQKHADGKGKVKANSKENRKARRNINDEGLRVARMTVCCAFIPSPLCFLAVLCPSRLAGSFFRPHVRQQKNVLHSTLRPPPPPPSFSVMGSGDQRLFLRFYVKQMMNKKDT
ncbi:hypothetical protein E2C01_101328 [Portunus trituberculatus]|uniref:Uncharacterized protein n=1 Tax=Portunus trituberculatus TaxID=210409 RepID=A0A5B7KJU5_PORTR|nr:hypothetical protein [Portunus trituberculatus]